jgi:hypothetical protein
MEAKDKAKELIDKFLNHVDDCSKTSYFEYENAKQCALICVHEIIEEIQKVFTPKLAKLNGTYNYRQEVKQELEK